MTLGHLIAPYARNILLLSKGRFANRMVHVHLSMGEKADDSSAASTGAMKKRYMSVLSRDSITEHHQCCEAITEIWH